MFFDGCDTKVDIKKRWKELSQVHHPDKGGDAEQFCKISAEYQKLLNKLDSQPVKCTVCKGTGSAIMNYGFNTVYLTCPCCKGSGKVMRS